MHRWNAYLAAVCFTLMAAGSAYGQEQDHQGQFAARLSAGGAYVQTQSGGSSAGTPSAIVNLQLSYAPLAWLEIELGASSLPNADYLAAIVAGVRWYYNPMSFLKVYTSLDALVPVYPDTGGGVQAEAGVQYDIGSHFAVYAGGVFAWFMTPATVLCGGALAGVQGRL
ncbi:MAG: hypothetical protein WC889_15845 [Myxococcota bacterium]|jgi:hypothetical protein